MVATNVLLQDFALRVLAARATFGPAKRFRVNNSKTSGSGLRFRVKHSKTSGSGLGFRVNNSKTPGSGLGFIYQLFKTSGAGLGFRVSDFKFRFRLGLVTSRSHFLFSERQNILLSFQK